MDDWKLPGKETACQKWTLIQSRRSSHQSNNCFTARVRHAGIAVADDGGKEFDEAAAGAFAPSADNYRQRFESGTDQRRRRYTDCRFRAQFVKFL
jgi:hypothetical protein